LRDFGELRFIVLSDVVPLENLSGQTSSYLHRHPLRYASARQIPHRRPAKVVPEFTGEPGLLTSPAPSALENVRSRVPCLWNRRVTSLLLRYFWQLGVHVIPGLGTHGVNVLARPKLTGVIQAAHANGHQLWCRAGQAKEWRPALAAEGPPSRMPTGRGEREVLRAPPHDSEGRFGHAQDGGKGTARLALTIPTVTMEREEWSCRTFIANRAARAATREGSRHRHIFPLLPSGITSGERTAAFSLSSRPLPVPPTTPSLRPRARTQTLRRQ